MTKLSLYINEILKLSKRISLFVIIGVTSVIMILMSVGFKATEKNYYYDDGNFNWWQEIFENYTEMISRQETELEKIGQYILESQPMEFDGLISYLQNLRDTYESLAYLKQECGEAEIYAAVNDLGAKNSVFIGDAIRSLENDFRIVSFTEAHAKATKVINSLSSIEDIDKALMTVGFNVNQYYSEEEIAAAEKNVAELVPILKAHDFKKYIEWSNAKIMADENLSQNAKDISIEANNLLVSTYPDGLYSDEVPAELAYTIREYAEKRSRLADAEAGVGEKISQYEEKTLREQVCELKLKFEVKAAGYGGRQNMSQKGNANSLLTAASFGAALVMLLASAVLISDEIQTGSIKMLVVVPAKRNKIFNAKVYSLATLNAIIWLFLFVVFVLCNAIGGFGSAPVVFTFLGKPHVLNYYVYFLLAMGFDMLKIFIYAMFALMLSSVTRNNAVSVAVSLVEYFAAANIVPAIIYELSSDNVVLKILLRFIPGINIDMGERIFVEAASRSDFDLIDIITGGFVKPQGSFVYGVCMVVVLFFALYLTARDSFCKRDLK